MPDVYSTADSTAKKEREPLYMRHLPTVLYVEFTECLMWRHLWNANEHKTVGTALLVLHRVGMEGTGLDWTLSSK